MHDLYIGLMSGTSMDAVDAVLVDFSQQQPKLIASHQEELPTDLRSDLLSLCQPGFDEINRSGSADIQVAQLFARAANQLLINAHVPNTDVTAIGSHGQTIRHSPEGQYPFTLQIGDPNTLAEITGITTVADFRRRDMAKGGQGAPLTPAFHNAVFRNLQHNRIVLNLGGIANITWLPAQPEQQVIGFDTGPANVLLDAWISLHLQENVDKEGRWAASGKIDSHLLDMLLQDSYFARSYPKSTGREYFNLDWLNSYLKHLPHSPATADVQATLCELTAITIAHAIHALTEQLIELFICGGGINNTYLIERIKFHCKNATIHSTEVLGVAPQLVEAMAFAWLAKQTMSHKTGNLPSVTNAKKPVILGGVYFV